MSRNKNNRRGRKATPQPSGYRPAYDPTSKRRSSGVTYVNPATASSGAYSGPRPAPKKKHTGRKVAIGILVVLLVACVGVGTAAALYFNQLNQAIGIKDTEQAAAIDEALAPTVPNEPFYMMIIGSDTRNDEFGQRSDTNIVARIDPSTATVTLISIPRDTAINLEGYGIQKFNAAYNYYGAKGAIEAANDLLGIKISHYAEIDFTGLIELVDSVGGVEVDVPMRIEDADAGGIVEAGQQTLDGEHALIFARSRSYTTGDFQRSTNQRLLVEAFMQKVLSMPAGNIPGLVKTAAGCISTDLSLTDIIGFIQKFQEADEVTIYSALMPSTTATKEGVDYVVCDTQTLAEVMSIINQGGDPSSVIEDYTISSSAQAEELGETGIPVYVETDLVNGEYDGSDYSYEGE